MSRPHHSDDDNDDGWDQETGSAMDSNSRHPFSTASTNPNAPRTAAALERERRGQSYYLPASTAGSLAPNHGRYQPFNSKQHRTVNASIFGAYLRATATLHMTVVVFYPFDCETNNALGWDKPENRTAAVTAVNHALGTLHDNKSLCIRLANEGATRMQTRLKNGETIGPAFVHFLNSMTSGYGVDTFKLHDDNENGDDDEEDNDNGNSNDNDNANNKVGRDRFE